MLYISTLKLFAIKLVIAKIYYFKSWNAFFCDQNFLTAALFPNTSLFPLDFYLRQCIKQIVVKQMKLRCYSIKKSPCIISIRRIALLFDRMFEKENLFPDQCYGLPSILLCAAAVCLDQRRAFI
jgi:hypothetical protein